MWQWCGMEAWGAVLPVPRAAVTGWEMPRAIGMQGLKKREQRGAGSAQVESEKAHVGPPSGPMLQSPDTVPTGRRRPGGYPDRLWASSPAPLPAS